MPNWKTHLEISKRLNQYYKFNEKEYELFLVGSILPDINNSYVVTGISEKIGHKVTHYVDEAVPTYKVFYEKYKKEIDEHSPIFVGYVTHLFTDYTWNNNFYTLVAKRDFYEKDRENLRILKQSDFKIFNNKFVQNHIDIKHNSYEDILGEIARIPEVRVTADDLKRVDDFLKEDNLYDATYQFFSEEELDVLLENTVEKLNRET